ncbi:MAG: CDP-alcohol phosphatidyltransferase family protein [Paludibacteraceae bacterium]|jgi:Phosphatidylserine synthase|nr:CDP-alcohol phosphatidyltransferase family protein [Paludibacteraceae bacterium]MBO7456015.1 CDP-alcohol phosphatidyltransferase family protein [Paludibacteraceae bacterium]
MKKHIPNIITCCNLLCGAIAVMLAAEGLFHCALGMIVLGALFDFFDGMSARALKVSNPIGKEIDSLADVITFGLAPSVMLMQAIRLATENSNYSWGWWSAAALVMAAFSALRLAKFNIDERQTSSFIGLATPANAIFWASLIAAFPDMASWGEWLPFAMLAVAALSCWLLVCELPFFSLKFHSLKWKENQTRYIFLIGCVLVIALCCTFAVLRGNYHYALFSGTGVILWYIIANLFPEK